MFKILPILVGITTLCFSNTLPIALQNNSWLSLYFQPSSLFNSFIALTFSFLLFKALFKALTIHSLNSQNKVRFKTLVDATLLFLLAAIYAQSIAQSQLNSRLPSHLDGSDIVITGTIIGLVERHKLDSYRQQNFYQRFLFKVNQFDNNLNADALNSHNNNSHYKPRVIQINNYKYSKLNLKF